MKTLEYIKKIFNDYTPIIVVVFLVIGLIMLDKYNEQKINKEKFENKMKEVNDLLKKAEQGETFAQNNLGYMYEIGDGVTKNYAKAVEWYTKAAEQGDVDSQNKLGSMYEFGEGVTKNYTKAFEWYKKAAEQGSYDAIYNLEMILNSKNLRFNIQYIKQGVR